MRRTASVVAVLAFVLFGCGGGDDDAGSSGGGNSDFCTTIRQLTDDLAGLDSEYTGDDLYGEVADAYRALRDAAPSDLADDFDRVIDGFDKIRTWSEDPTSEYPFTDEEDAELEASMNRIDALASDDCGIDTEGGSDDDGPPPDPTIELESLDDATSDDGVTMSIDGDDGSVDMSLGGDLPDDFPFAVPDVYEVGSSFQFDDASGTTYSAVLNAPEDDFDAIVAFYDEFLNSEGFEVVKSDFSSDDGRFVMMTGERSDATASITMSTEEVANDADGNLIFETNVSLTWMPAG